MVVEFLEVELAVDVDGSLGVDVVAEGAFAGAFRSALP